MSANIPLPPLLETNPRLDQWVKFAEPGKVTVSTGRVEIGQGVLTAMLQIAADELDVSPERIVLQTGDTDLTPNEGYTAGSQSIQYGGVALRLACAEVRAMFLDHAAARFGHERDELSVDDGAIARRGKPTGQDYWSLASEIDLSRHATAGTAPKSGNYREIGRDAARVDLAGKVFGAPSFVHDMIADGMIHARVVRQPQRGATIASIDEAAIRRAGKGAIDILRDGNFVAILGDDETTVDAAAAVAPGHVAWDGIDPINPGQEEARWLLQRPTIDQSLGAPPYAPPSPYGPRSPKAAAVRRVLLRYAADVLSGPAGLAAFLRTGLLDGAAGSISLPLDTGKPGEEIPAHLRRLVIARDRRCAFPGCRQRPAACQVHHIKPRSKGGRTILTNLLLLCAFHHLIAVHRWGWQLSLNADGTVTAVSPDGQRTLHSHGPPALAA